MSNRLALQLLPILEGIIKDSDDEMEMAVRLAIIGNVIDFGIFKDVDIKGEVEGFLFFGLSIDDFDKFCTKVVQNDRILYILDNAGEIVFDRLLIGELIKRGKEVTAVVRGGPVLNDVTMADADDTGLLNLCQVVDNGSDCVGTVLEECSPGFVNAYYDFPFVISKGQANYETLIGSRKDIAFLFMAKCEVVAGHLSVPEKGMILKVL
ncbi:MAG: DUF89 family protein [Nitrospirae bacterium]|nr:MAG: DUF89 family protein [Nitrospirota bacterium]